MLEFGLGSAATVLSTDDPVRVFQLLDLARDFKRPRRACANSLSWRQAAKVSDSLTLDEAQASVNTANSSTIAEKTIVMIRRL
jgi:hypothetical protein